MTGREILPCNLERMLQDGFRQIGQTVADIGDRDAKQIGTPKLRQNLHLCLAVAVMRKSQAAFQLGAQLDLLHAFRVNCGIEQLVKQHRESCQLFGDIGAALAQADKSPHGQVIFVQ